MATKILAAVACGRLPRPPSDGRRGQSSSGKIALGDHIKPINLLVWWTASFHVSAL